MPSGTIRSECSSECSSERCEDCPFVTGSELLKFRTPPLGLVPYVALDVSGDELPRRACIGEIVIGPTSHAEIAERSLRLLLAAIGYEEDQVLVICFKTPLRA